MLYSVQTGCVQCCIVDLRIIWDYEVLIVLQIIFPECLNLIYKLNN